MMIGLVQKPLAFSSKTMAESRGTHDSDVVILYNFEPHGLWSSIKESDSDDNNRWLVLQSTLVTCWQN